MNKGISPLIAGVLLIAFTLAIAAIVSGWLVSLTKTTTKKVETGVSTQVECSKGNIEIEEVKFNSTANTTIVLLHNTGTTDLTGGFIISCGDYVKSTTGPNMTSGSLNWVSFSVNCTGTSKVMVTSQVCPSVKDTCKQGEDCWGL